MKEEKEETKIYVEKEKAFSKNLELAQSFFGEIRNNKLYLNPIEVIYLANIRNAKVFEGRNQLTVSQVFQKFYSPFLFVRYSVFRDWRDRGLFISFPKKLESKDYGKSPVKKYPASEFKILTRFSLYFLKEECFSLAFGKEAKKAYEEYWFGQWGV
ncbi:MAG: hypothetical protein QXT38_03850, partial [Candidatus Aenigmatarchaeota archaeon]